jgi:hypothetical protein
MGYTPISYVIGKKNNGTLRIMIRKNRKWSRFCIIKVKDQEKFVFRFRLSFEKCIFLKNEIQFDKFDGFYLMDHILH